MKTSRWSRVVLVGLGSAAVALAAAPVERRAAPAFELPRLKARGAPDDPRAMARERATVHELAPNDKATAHARADGKVEYLALDPNTSWASPLRGAAKDTTFVSFFVYASEGTSIELAGAKLIVRAGGKPGYAQLQIGRPSPKGVLWRNFGGPVKLETHDGAALAALPVLTARLDPTAGVWDLYVGSRLGAADLPLPDLPKGASRRFAVHAGGQGAFVCGLVSSDDNPLYEDENRNGIDDVFERRHNRGKLLTAPGLARANLAKQWQEDQQGGQLQAWAVQRPRPDNLPATPPGK